MKNFKHFDTIDFEYKENRKIFEEHFKDILSYDKLNNVEEFFYNNLKPEERRLKILKNFQLVIEKIINEFIKKDIIMRTSNSVWVCINLDSLYSPNIDYSLEYSVLKQIFPRTKNYELALKMVSNNILLATLSRCDLIVLYNRQVKSNYPKELVDEIKFTKGYVVCFHPRFVDICKNLYYRRKIYHREPVVVETTAIIVSQALNNNYFSSPVWLRNSPIEVNEFLNTEFDSKKITKILNILNGQKMKVSMDIFTEIYKYAEITGINSDCVITRNKLSKLIYEIRQKEETEYLEISDDVKTNFQKIISSASILELMKSQYERILKIDGGFFYLSHRLDSRTRIYVHNYPINYQLIHIARITISFYNESKIKIVLTNFKTHPLFIDMWDFILKEVFLQNKIDIDSFLIEEKILIKGSLEEILIKKECWIQILNKVAPKKIRKTADKIKFMQQYFKYFINDDIVKHHEYWTVLFEIKDEKTIYLIYYKEVIIKMINDNYEDVIWLDASSNAVQLISLRMGFTNEKLLKLTNIIDNDLEENNIYSYVTTEINKMNHDEILEKINKKLSPEELISLQNNEDNKKRVMPASYGMTAYENRKKMNQILETDERSLIWNKLTSREKAIISNYFWKLTFEILKKIGYDLDAYKRLCDNQSGNIWFNDYGIPIVNNCYRTSQRNKLLKLIEKLKFKIKNGDDSEKTKKELKKIEFKMREDERLFWKRTKIKIYNKVYTIRINNEPYIRNKKKEKQALVPNSIHCYDASIMFKTIEICNELNIETLVIHDSIGCKNIYTPLLKIIFKTINIFYLKKASIQPPFPFNKPINTNSDLITKIIKSENFFR